MPTQLLTNFIEYHDFRVLLLATLIATTCALTMVLMAQRAREAAEKDRLRWIAKASLAGGGGIWAAHFMAMLAWDLGQPVAHGFLLNIVSGITAIVAVGASFHIASYNRTKRARFLSGLILGLGVAATQGIELLSVEVQGHLEVDQTAMAVGVTFFLLVFAGAGVVTNKTYDRVRQILAIALLAGGMMGMHAVLVASITFVPDPSLAVPGRIASDMVLGFVVALGSLAVLGFALASVTLDIHLTQHESVQVARLQSLADAAIEGIVVVDHGGHVVDANPSFMQLVCQGLRQLRGQDFARYFRDFPIGQSVTNLAERAAHIEETTLVSSVGEEIPTELYFKSAIVGGEPHNVVVVRDLRERLAAEQRINYLANYDTLTGLANRQLLLDRLSQSMAAADGQGQKVILHFVDLDFFKELNTTIGQQQADQLLKFIAGRLSSNSRGMVNVARIGADQFCIVQEGVASADAAELLLERLRRKLGDPFSVAGKEVKVSACIGTAVAPDDAAVPSTLIARAEIAMKKAKSLGPGSNCFYESKVDQAQELRRKLKMDLVGAIERGEIFLHYQPQFDVDSGTATGFEALARWEHPERGLISPAEWIPLAEESGAILEIGRFLLEDACREAASWANPLRIAVNLSPVQFLESDLTVTIASILRKQGLPPSRLELEITEGVLIEDEKRAIEMLVALKDLGILLAMDDFGTGYSSLSYLRQFPFDKLKIDKSFIMNLRDDPQSLGIVKGMIGLAHGLNIPVLAEGVETEAQLSMLRLEHGDEVQGYFTGKPAPIDQYADVINTPPSDAQDVSQRA